MKLVQDDRCQLAEKLARDAGALGLQYFARLDQLQVDRKGHQDLVSEADKALEKQIRAGIQAAFPQDGILGEEDGYVAGDNDYVWVIDP
ncbi:MAG: inositol monophosphatase, partial [Alphaproteobacteria bacterium]|nr:inositol monophosphatase [Alphaproteobacteria bacterium]